MAVFDDAPIRKRLGAGLVASFLTVSGLSTQQAEARTDELSDILPKVCMTVDKAIAKTETMPPSPLDEKDKRYRLHPGLYADAQSSLTGWMYLRLSFDAAKAYNLNPVLFANQIYHESNHYNPKVIAGNKLSRTGAVGVAQIQPDTGTPYGMSEADYVDPQRSIYYGARIKCDIKHKYRGDETLALVGYNGGVVGKKKGDVGPVGFAAQELKTFSSLVTGDVWLDFNEKRNKERNNEKKFPAAWHNETLKYVKVIDGSGWPKSTTAWAERQQGEGYLTAEIDTPKFWAGMFKEQLGTLVALAYGEEKTPVKDDPFAALLGKKAEKEVSAAVNPVAITSLITTLIAYNPVRPNVKVERGFGPN